MNWFLILLFGCGQLAVAAADYEVLVRQAREGFKAGTESSRLKVGAQIYAGRCARCHGVPGKSQGRGLFDSPDLSTGTYKFRSTRSGALPRDADILRSVSEGIPGTRMPGFSFLSLADRWALVLYLKSLSSYFEGGEEPEALLVPPAPPETAERVQKGQLWFVAQRCFECHGPQGRGDGPQAKTLKDSQNRPITPASFAAGRFKSGPHPRDWYRTLLTGLDGTPMASYGEGAFLIPQEGLKLTGEGGKVSYPALEAIRPALDSATSEKLKALMDSLPTQAQLAKMAPEAKAKLEAERRWELVYFLKALRKK